MKKVPTKRKRKMSTNQSSMMEEEPPFPRQRWLDWHSINGVAVKTATLVTSGNLRLPRPRRQPSCHPVRHLRPVVENPEVPVSLDPYNTITVVPLTNTMTIRVIIPVSWIFPNHPPVPIPPVPIPTVHELSWRPVIVWPNLKRNKKCCFYRKREPWNES